MLKDRVEETTNNPGTSVEVVLVPKPGGVTFAAAFGAAPCFYFLTDGTQTEWGVGTVIPDAPNRLARTTVVGNSAGTTARLNFTGTCIVTNWVPSVFMPLLDGSGHLVFAEGRFIGLGVTPDAPLMARARDDGIMLKILGRLSDNASVIQFVSADNGTEIARIQATPEGGMLLATGAAVPAFFIDAAQNTMIGKVTPDFAVPGFQFIPSTDITVVTSDGPALAVRRNGSNGPLAVFYRDGTVAGTISGSGATVAYNTTSDGRLKDVEREIDGAEAEDVIRRLRPISYRWKHDPEAGSFAGFIAQEFGQVLPRGVTPGQGEPGDEDFMPMGMSADVTLPYVVAALNRAMDRIAALEAAAAG